MPLTPEDVQNKRFSTVRFKEGYDEEEVDAFLDEVEAELRRLLGENTDLRSSPAAAAPPIAAAPAPAPVAQPPAAPAEDPGRRPPPQTPPPQPLPPSRSRRPRPPRTPAKPPCARCCWRSAPPTR